MTFAKAVATPSLLAFDIRKKISSAFLVSSAVEGPTIQQLIRRSRDSAEKEKLLQKLGLAFAKLHKVGSYGDARLSNIVMTRQKRTGIINFDRSVLFHSAKHEDRMVCRQNDLINIVFDLLTTDSTDTNLYKTRNFFRNENYYAFMSAYVKYDKHIYSSYEEHKTIMPPTVRQLKEIFLHKSQKEMIAGNRKFHQEKFMPVYRRNTIKIEKIGHKVAFAASAKSK